MSEAGRAVRGAARRSERAGAGSGGGTCRAREADPEADARRAADAAIARVCADANYDLRVPDVCIVCEKLKDRALGSLIKLNASGQLMIKAAQALKIPDGQILPLPSDWANCVDVVLEEVANLAATTFITNHLPKWRPDGGASLNTWFTNYVLWLLWDAVKKLNRERIDLYDLSLDEVLQRDDGRLGPDEQAADQDLLRFALDTVFEETDVDMRLVLERISQRVGRREIARELGVSEKTIQRARQRLEAILNENGFSIRTGGK